MSGAIPLIFLTLPKVKCAEKCLFSFSKPNCFKLLSIFFILVSTLFFTKVNAEGEQQDLLKVDWSFKSFFGKFDRASLQRGYQVYNEVCASCHSLKHLSYRNLAEKGVPEFTEAEAKAIASNLEVT